VIEDCAKLTAYFGERERAGDRFLADALVDLFERRRVPASVLARGIEGFGAKHRIQSDRLLTLSEDLPLVAAAVDRADRIPALAAEAVALCGDGVLTLERARLVTGSLRDVELGGEPVKLTLWLGRHERAGDRPAFVAVVDALRTAGAAGASAFLGVDGTRDGARYRARFFGANTRIPLMLIAIGAGPAMARALAAIDALVPEPLALLERVRVCKAGGARLADPAGHVPPGRWQKVMVHGGPSPVELVARVRAAGADGATAIRGVWGLHGGDRLLALRRRAPVVTTIIDTPERAARWYPVVDALTERAGVVTSELVPARRASSGGNVQGDLDL
jgi:PII-like signaling protein